VNAPVSLARLRCPACQEHVAGDVRADRLFLCTTCPTALELGPQDARGWPLHFVAGGGAQDRYRPWWQLVAKVKVSRFAATEAAMTPWGEVKVDAQTTLSATFQVPAFAQAIRKAYEEALARAEQKAEREERNPDRLLSGGTYDRRAAEQIARQVFLTAVARAPGKVHQLEMTLEVSECVVLAR
jgi:hypothetical protein